LETGSQEWGSKTERKVYIKDQHPSREEIAWWRVAGPLTPCSGMGGGGKQSEVFCAVCCNKYRYILQFASYGFSLLSCFYVFLNVLIYILLTSLACS